MKWFRVLFFVLSILLTVQLVEAQEQPEITISLLPEIEIEGTEIYLGQVAEIKGAVPSVLEKLKQIYLGPAPRYAEITWLYRTNVKYALDRSGIPGEFDLEMPAKVKITRVGQILTKEMLMAAVETYIKNNASPLWEEWRVEPGRIQERSIPQGKVEILLADRIPPLKPGLLTFRLRVLVDGEVFTTMPVFFRLYVQAKVYITSMSLNKGEIITEDSFYQEIRELDDGNEFLNCLEPGKFRVTRELSAGKVLSNKDIQLVPMVFKGSKVRLVLQKETIHLELFVLAEEDGWLGDQILIKNLGSNRRLKATVIGAGLVEVRLD